MTETPDNISKKTIKDALSLNSDLQQKYSALMQTYLQKAVKFRHKIDTAKTDYKKRFYTKKLEKNNSEAFRVLSMMESVRNKIQKLSKLDNEVSLNSKLMVDDLDTSPDTTEK